MTVTSKMFRADLYSRVLGATIVDAILRLTMMMCFSVRTWVILDCLREYCLNGYVNRCGYVNGR